MKKHIVIIMNGKGGVGKSFFACNFVQYLKDHGIKHTAIDTDNENSTLKRFHPEALFIDIEEAREMDGIFKALESEPLVVVDCRAASTDTFLDYFSEIRVFEVLEMMGASLTVVSLVNHEADSVEQVSIIVEKLGHKCQYVIVKNEVYSERFRIYEQSHIRNHVLNNLAGYEIVMECLYDWLVTILNETNLSISSAIRHSEISLIDRQRLKNWQFQFNQQIESAKGALLLPEEEEIKPEAKPRKPKAQPATS